MSKRMDDLTGQKFGRLYVIGFGEPHIRKDGRKNTTFVCICDCGNKIVVDGVKLKNGNTKSCGCTRIEKVGMINYSHGEYHTRLYGIWCRMKQRCANPNTEEYGYYGGRGIVVCNEWENDFSSFKTWALSSGYNDSLTIDRIDTNSSYTPNNCRWVSRDEQSNNTRGNHNITFNGRTQTIARWAKETGIKRQTISRRLCLGWSVEDALTRNVEQRRKENNNGRKS